MSSGSAAVAARLRGAAVVAALALSACTYPSKVSPYVDPARPPLSVTVTTDPPPRDDGTVPRNARFIVQLDGYPDPDAVGFGPVQLHSGRGNFDIGFAVSLVKQQITVTPRALMAPGGQYDLVVSGLVALDDRVQGDDVVFPVLAGLDEGDPHPAPPRPTWNGTPPDGTDGVRAVIGGCAPACHSPVGASGRTRTPTRDLDLTGDPRDPVFGLVGVESVGLAGTPAPLYRVAPFDPAHSVLLRKLLGGSPQADSQDPPYPNLRVDGRRMPIALDETQSAPPLPTDQIQRVEDWIAAGAPVD
jgi:hypothetical protein